MPQFALSEEEKNYKELKSYDFWEDYFTVFQLWVGEGTYKVAN